MSDPLPNVLKKLTNEVMGLLDAYEIGLRELIGHTNYNCLKMRAEAGRDAHTENALYAARKAAEWQPIERAEAERLVAAERDRQINVEGYDAIHDDAYSNGELLKAAVIYYIHTTKGPLDIGPSGAPLGWPWETHWWKPGSRSRNLIRAGALAQAEIDRLKRRGADPFHARATFRLVIASLSERNQSSSFAHGFTCGKIWQQMRERSAPFSETIGAELREDVIALATAAGWIEEFIEIDDEWLRVTFMRDGPNRT